MLLRVAICMRSSFRRGSFSKPCEIWSNIATTILETGIVGMDRKYPMVLTPTFLRENPEEVIKPGFTAHTSIRPLVSFANARARFSVSPYILLESRNPDSKTYTHQTIFRFPLWRRSLVTFSGHTTHVYKAKRPCFARRCCSADSLEGNQWIILTDAADLFKIMSSWLGRCDCDRPLERRLAFELRSQYTCIPNATIRRGKMTPDFFWVASVIF